MSVITDINHFPRTCRHRHLPLFKKEEEEPKDDYNNNRNNNEVMIEIEKEDPTVIISRYLSSTCIVG